MIALNNERQNPEDHALEVSIFDMMNHMETPSNFDRSGHGQMPSNISPYNSSLNIDRGLNKQKSALDDAFKQPLIHQDVHQAADRNANGRGNCRNSVAMPSILAESSPSPALKNIVAAPF